MSNELDDFKSRFKNEINYNAGNKFGSLSCSKKDDISPNIFKELDLKIDLTNKTDSTEDFFANTPSKKDVICANIRDLHLKTDLENEKYSIDRGKCTSVESLPKKSFEEIIQRRRQEFNPSNTKVNSIYYV